MTEIASFKYLSVRTGPDDVSFRCPDIMSQLHPKAVKSGRRLFVKAMAKRLGPKSGRDELADAMDTLAILDHRIAAIIEAPLTGGQVERALAISGKERRRWTKDGRLPTCAKSVSGRSAKLFSLPLYDVERIAGHAADLASIERWRVQDALDLALATERG
ncbi:MAG TPA: hypothetical protein VGM83_11415 [Devosiaceae bacterium]|jgi:hypothetical protein